MGSQQNAIPDQSQEIPAKVLSVVSAELGVPQSDLAQSSTLQELGIDSLHGLSIITELENFFKVHLENELIATILTLGDIVRAIENTLGDNSGAGTANA
jgi:acyl carrier protein